MNILVTGGAGYIGSHAALRLLSDNHAVTVIDNLVRGNRGAIEALEKLKGDFLFVNVDVGDRARLETILRQRRIELVMHFAGLTYVGESVQQPLRYYRANEATFTKNGISYLRPEIVMWMKAKHDRRKDDADLAQILPQLEPGRRAWLRDRVQSQHPDHRWLKLLTE